MTSCELSAGLGVFIFICIIVTLGILSLMRLFRCEPEYPSERYDSIRHYERERYEPRRRRREPSGNLFVIFCGFLIFMAFLTLCLGG